ncbi:MAG TPA: polysaccharide deacetylase family protein [Chloroflexaceae bacterium]|nr:polysaccharide deacetylase family protein [Chloroflexaceae bacterium]
MRLPGLAAMRHVAGRARRLFAPGALILVYHRVADVTLDPWSLAVSPARFAEQMEVLARVARPMPLPGLVAALREGRVPPRAVAVTFDDGYLDNLLHAWPALERHEVPATVFIVTGQVGGDRAFWWDELAELLLLPAALPPRLELRIRGRTVVRELGAAAGRAQAEPARRPWESAPGTRAALHYEIWQELLPLPDAAQQETLAALRAWAAQPQRPAAARPMRWPEVAQLARGGLVELGAHTVTHLSLTDHAPEVQAAEIRESKAELERRLGAPVASFAYPYGRHDDRTAALVEAAGIGCACTVEARTIWRPGDCLRLPRYEALDWDGDQFAARLERWLRG